MISHEYPFVTVIIPAKNESQFLESCLDSIIGGSYPKSRLEIIVVDGMSIDGTSDIVRNYAKKHGCVKLLINEKGITSAGLNVGIKQAMGDYELMTEMGENGRRAVREVYNWETMECKMYAVYSELSSDII